MIEEVEAAVQHLSTFLHPTVDASKFREQVQSVLQSRYASIWHTDDPTRASASRAVHWHAHGGGEGRDKDIHQACLDHCSQEEEVHFFSSPFTLWVDPGCVSIRMGHGPGIYLPGSFIASSIAFKVLFSRALPPVTRILSPPVLTVQPSTPALDTNTGAWSSMSSQILPRRPSTIPSNHARMTSTSSLASSCNDSRSTSAGSYLSSLYDSDRCPSLVSTSTSARDSDSELSLEDMIDSGCYKNFDIIDDEDEGDFGHEEPLVMGDDTIHGQMDDMGDETICQDDVRCPSKSGAAAIVNYDGGNVGVLGGGIRLGSSSNSATTSSGNARRSTSNAFPSYHSGPGQYAPPLPPPNSFHGFEQSLGFPTPGQQYMNMDGYAIPMTKRVRSRGRRSRGRGAGRAARRQAAALQALTEAEQNLTESMSPLQDYQDIVAVDGCEDERIMAIVRQRADQVAKDMVKRHLEQERRKAEVKLQQTQYTHHQHVYPQQQQHQQQYQQQQSHSFPYQYQMQQPYLHALPRQVQAGDY